MELFTLEYINSQYRELKLLSKGKRLQTHLVRSTVDGTLAVKKQVDLSQAEIYRRLQSCPVPNLPRVLYVLPFPANCVVLEEYVAGETLERKLEREGPLPEETIVSYALQLCGALGWLHQNNLVHRDVTPSNIVVSYKGEVKLIDFDISRSVKPDRSQDTTILGTVGYAAPEQFGFHQSDCRTDLYSLGVLINVMATGRFPNEHIASGWLGEIVKECTHIDPQDRFQTVSQLCRALHERPSAQQKLPHELLGFRSHTKWKMVVAALGYAALLFFLPLNLVIHSDSPRRFVLNLLFYLLVFVLPFVLWSDFDRIGERLPLLRSASPRDRRIARILLGFSSIMLDLILAIPLGG